MAGTPDLLDQPARRAARIIALALLDDAAKARRQLGTTADGALHDFRVATRRLRSWLRSLDPWLEGSVSKKARRRLEKAARLTGKSRDAEVHLAWLAEQRHTFTARQRYGLDWLVERIESEKHDTDALIGDKATKLFDAARDELAETLPVYTARVYQDDIEDTCGVVMAGLLRAHAEQLAERLAGIESFEDTRRVHKARIAAKRLRYLLEPIARDVIDGSALVRELASLQDTLGDWHDVHVFSSTILDASEQAGGDETRRVSALVVKGDEVRHALRAGSEKRLTRGLLALAERLRERGDGAFSVARERWLGAGAELVQRVERIASSLETRPSVTTARPPRDSGDRAGAEQMQKELDEENGGNGGRNGAGSDARESHQGRSRAHRGRPLEQPTVGETPTA
jgi:CHAD domain-containing protein